MAEYINKQKVLELMRYAWDENGWDTEYGWLRQHIADEPSADVLENVRGEWIIRKCALGHEYTECSNCNTVFDIETHNGTLEWIDLRGASFCPNCGADMRGEK